MIHPWLANDFHRLLERRANLPHALLIAGAQGLGKLSLAEALARALLCEQPQAEGAACGRCRACQWMEQEAHPDFRRLQPDALGAEVAESGERREKASNQITVEAVRALGDFINVSSHRGGAKVVLIHPAEALNANAANALLKSLEEPPPGTHFFLVSHRWHRLMPTLKSRCEHVLLTRPTLSEGSSWLEQQGIPEPALALAHAGGTPLSAARLGPDYWEARRAFLSAISEASSDPLAIAERLGDTPPALVVGWMQKWGCDIVWFHATGTVRYNPDFEGAIAVAAGRIGHVAAVRLARHQIRLQRVVSHPLNPRLFLEELLIDYLTLLHTEPGAATRRNRVR